MIRINAPESQKEEKSNDFSSFCDYIVCSLSSIYLYKKQ